MTTPLKLIGAPGSITFLLLCLAVGRALVWAWPSRPAIPTVWFAAVGVVYVALATPVIAIRIANALMPAHQSIRLDELQPVDLIVVFDGDNRRGRVAEALRASREWPSAQIGRAHV